MAARMAKNFDNLTRTDVSATHWALVEASDAVNEIIKKWFTAQVKGPTSSL
jgi:soluble epoxide hydrolase/lipid-phosphate phosphatase